MMPGAGGLNYAPVICTDPFDLLGRLANVRIKQKARWQEVILGFDMPNKYIISDATTGHDLFIAAERSDGMMGMIGRQVFSGSQRPFNLDISLLQGGGVQPTPFLTAHRPFTCTCCCFNRPEMTIYNAMTSQPIGTTVEPFSCCHFRIGLKDAMRNDVLKINHSCCDCSLCCWGCPCGCQETTFDVEDVSSQVAVGKVRREFNAAQAIGMMTGVNADSDQFSVEFMQVQAAEWKAMLIATAIFLDYCYFTKGGQEARDESALGRVVRECD